MSRTCRQVILPRFHERIQEKREDRGHRPLLIAAFGDSVTEGALELGVYNYQTVYHARLKYLLEQCYPGITFNMINAGISGQSSSAGLTRIDRDVLRYQPDLILVAFGLNDSALGAEGLSEFAGNLRQIVTRILETPQSEIILLTCNHIAAQPNAGVAPEHQHFLEPFIER